MEVDFKKFKENRQYFVDRDVFVSIFRRVDDLITDVYPYESSDVKIWWDDDEWYVLYKPSGILINWYKHLGRTNTCNKDLTIDELKYLALLIEKDIKENI